MRLHKVEKQMLAYGMPIKSIQELTHWYCEPDFSDIKAIQIYQDPQLEETFALRITKKDNEFDLLWNHGAYDEVDFESFPPVSGNLKFFI
jgi:hypothetical protein